MLDLDLLRPFLDDRHASVAAEAAEVAAEVAALPAAEDDGAARRQARELLALFGDARLPRHAVPESWGGSPHGPDLRACCLVRDALAAASPLADSVFALQGLGSMPVVLAGSEALRRRWLPEVIAGRAMAAFAMTEPESGSDVASMSTRAIRDGSDWILEGTKHLITNAGVADFYCVFAATEPGAGGRGISCFLVEADNPRLHFVGPQVLSEPHPLGEIAFSACRVPGSSLLGAPGEGFKLGMRTLDRLRPTVAAAACGMASRALGEALGYAASRRQFGAPMSDLQMTQQKLARMATDLAASRLLTYRAAFEADRGAERITLEAAMAKGFSTEAAQRVVDDAVQILGGRGVLAQSPVDRLYRAVRALRIYEGATEVQHLVIARQLLRRSEV
ncbi:MAG: acyl-CoA dehydrogenase family protein [Acidobacteriota bacterium]